MTRVVLEAKNSATLSAPQVSLERDPYRLVIQVNKAGTTPKTAVNLFPNAPEVEKNKLAIVVPPPTKEDLQMRLKVPKMRIVVDAGHGGWDLGTVGRRGLLEKDLVFEISQRLGRLLESRLGADVIYTRPDDNYIPLDERAVIANTAQADLFVSVHANYSDTPSARGIETYYTNLFSAPGSKDLSNPAGPKEAAMRSTPKNVPMPTLTPGELRDRIEQSRRLAPACSGRCMGRCRCRIRACAIAASRKPDSSSSLRAPCREFWQKSPSSRVPRMNKNSAATAIANRSPKPSTRASHATRRIPKA